MPNKLIIFPETKHSEATAYKAACDAHYALNFELDGQFAYVRNDAFDQWVVPFYGPPWEFITGQLFEEPAECAVLRVDGVLHETAVWPEEEDV